MLTLARSTTVLQGLLLLLCGVSALCAADVDVSGELRTWHRVTLTFQGGETGENAEPNPFRDMRIDVTFTHTESGRKYVVPAFYAADGDAAESGATEGSKWRVHFAPDAPGRWNWRTQAWMAEDVAIDLSDAPEPHAEEGSFEVEESNATGRDFRAHGRLEYVGERYLRFKGTGEPFLKGGADSPENLLGYADFDGTYRHATNKKEGKASTDKLHRYEPHVRDWRPGDPTWRDGKGKGLVGAMNYLSSQGMNSVYFLTMNVTGDGKDVWPWTKHDVRDRFDCSKLDQWEIVFDHMTKQGLMLHVILQEQENDQLLDGGELGPERKLYLRELIARFAHHPAVVWNLGEENTNTPEQRRAMCRFIRETDPYDHPIVCHTFPNKIDEVYPTLLGFEHFEGPSLQTNDTHRNTVKWVRESAKAGRPWFVCLDEIGPAHTGVKPDADDPDHDEVRKKHLWGNLMGGGAGVEWYFGYRFAHNDLNCEDWRSREAMWKQTRVALDFFHQHLPFTEMQPADGLTVSKEDFVLAKPGEVYAVYLPEAAETTIDLVPGQYSRAWFDAKQGGEIDEADKLVEGGPGTRLESPKQGDWVLLLRRK